MSYLFNTGLSILLDLMWDEADGGFGRAKEIFDQLDQVPPPDILLYVEVGHHVNQLDHNELPVNVPVLFSQRLEKNLF